MKKPGAGLSLSPNSRVGAEETPGGLHRLGAVPRPGRALWMPTSVPRRYREAEDRFMADEHKLVVQRLFDEFYNGRDLDVADQLMSTDVVDHSPAPGQRDGVKGVKEAFAQTLRRYPDAKASVEEIIVERDFVVVRYRLSGPNALGMSMFKLARGQIVESWHAFYPVTS